MFELAHRLVGIYKTSNVSDHLPPMGRAKLTQILQCTKSIAIDNKDLRTQAMAPKRTPQTPAPGQKQVPSTERRAMSTIPATPATPATVIG
jgi:structural maintenance of chromosome 4